MTNCWSIIGVVTEANLQRIYRDLVDSVSNSIINLVSKDPSNLNDVTFISLNYLVVIQLPPPFKPQAVLHSVEEDLLHDVLVAPFEVKHHAFLSPNVYLKEGDG